MFFDREKKTETAKVQKPIRGNEAPKSAKEKRTDKKRKKLKDFLRKGFQEIVTKAAALMDYFVRGRKTIREIIRKGQGIGKSIKEQEGYYSQEELNSFGLAEKSAKKEEQELDSASSSMRRLLERDYKYEGTVRHLTQYYESEVKSSFTRFVSATHPLILKPKSNIVNPSQDNSEHSFGKRVAALALLGFSLLNEYQGKQNEMHSWRLEIQEKSPIVSVEQMPTMKAADPNAKIFTKSPLEKEKELVELEKAGLELRGQVADIFKDKLEGKKTALRTFRRVDVEMNSTLEGNAIRERLGIKIEMKRFRFGDWNVKYT